MGQYYSTAECGLQAQKTRGFKWDREQAKDACHVATNLFQNVVMLFIALQNVEWLTTGISITSLLRIILQKQSCRFAIIRETGACRMWLLAIV